MDDRVDSPWHPTMRKPKRRRRSERIRGGGDAVPADPPAMVSMPGESTARAKDRNNRGLALIGEGHPQQAVVELREAIRLDPRLPGAHNNLGIALQVLGELRAAEAEYRAAIRLDPWSYPARVNLGNLLRDRLHDYAGAAAELREALRLRPGDAALLARMATGPGVGRSPRGGRGRLRRVRPGLSRIGDRRGPLRSRDPQDEAGGLRRRLVGPGAAARGPLGRRHSNRRDSELARRADGRHTGAQRHDGRLRGCPDGHPVRGRGPPPRARDRAALPRPPRPACSGDAAGSTASRPTRATCRRPRPRRRSWASRPPSG